MGQTPRKWTQVNQWYLGWPFGVHFMSPWSIWGPLFYVFIYQSELSEALIYDLFLKARFIYHIVYQNHYKHILEWHLSTLVFNICHHTQLFLPRVIKLNICPNIFGLYLPLADFFKWQMQLISFTNGVHDYFQKALFLISVFGKAVPLSKLCQERSCLRTPVNN